MEHKIRILLVEDEIMLAEILSDTLSDRDFAVDLARDGVQGLELASNSQYDVIVTDVMMPKMDGFTMVKKLRSQGCSTPVLFLTARCATEDVVKGFDLGGNDYLKKPFAIDELIARLRSLAARSGVCAAVTKELKFPMGKYEFTPSKCLLQDNGNGENIKLAARESAVLEYLCRNMGNTVEASAILKDLWGDDNFFNLRSLNVYITRLRGHLKEAPEVEIISTRGVGYRIEVRN